MRSFPTALMLVSFCCSQALAQTEQKLSAGPRNELAAGYRHVDSTGTSIGFSLNGGFLSFSRQLMPLLGVATEVAQTRTSDVGSPGGSFTLLTAGTGPRIDVKFYRTELFAQGIFGIARGSQVYAGGRQAGTGSVTSRMLQFGGGLNVRLSPRFSLRVLDLEDLITSFDEATGTTQRHLTLGTGLVWRFNARIPQRREYVEPEMTEIWFTCGTDTPLVTAGESVKILGHAGTEPDLIDLNYAWKTDGGRIVGSGREVRLDTSGMLPGRHRIAGVASLVSSPATTKDCAFNVQVMGAYENQTRATR